MLPFQLRKAIKENSPVVIPLGVLEYHSEHLPLGVDTLVVDLILRRLEKKHPGMVLLPAFYYGCASYAVAAPEGNGSLDIDSRAVSHFAEELFQSLLEVGFRNIHGFIFHQSENFQQGMPTDLAFRFAARRCLFSFLEKKHGRGWWGRDDMQNYYDGNNPFDYIQIHPIDTPRIAGKYPTDHAGKQETSLMMDLAPELVNMKRFSGRSWFVRKAVDASPAYGRKIADAYGRCIEKILFGGVSWKKSGHGKTKLEGGK